MSNFPHKNCPVAITLTPGFPPDGGIYYPILHLDGSTRALTWPEAVTLWEDLSKALHTPTTPPKGHTRRTVTKEEPKQPLATAAASWLAKRASQQ